MVRLLAIFARLLVRLSVILARLLAILLVILARLLAKTIGLVPRAPKGMEELLADYWPDYRLRLLARLSKPFLNRDY